MSFILNATNLEMRFHNYNMNAYNYFIYLKLSNYKNTKYDFKKK